MIIPMVCFTCGKPIAHLWLNYLDLVKDFELQRKADISRLEREQETSDTVTSIEELKAPEFNALARLKISRLCCRRMFLCQQDMYDKIR
jgi:DNA-directed RNA polymerase subunit N (RpoN/RPB10)